MAYGEKVQGIEMIRDAVYSSRSPSGTSIIERSKEPHPLRVNAALFIEIESDYFSVISVGRIETVVQFICLSMTFLTNAWMSFELTDLIASS